VAAQDTTQRQVKTFEGAVFPEGLQTVLGAGRGEAARRRRERRDADLIESDQENKRRNGYLPENAMNAKDAAWKAIC